MYHRLSVEWAKGRDEVNVKGLYIGPTYYGPDTDGAGEAGKGRAPFKWSNDMIITLDGGGGFTKNIIFIIIIVILIIIMMIFELSTGYVG